VDLNRDVIEIVEGGCPASICRSGLGDQLCEVAVEVDADQNTSLSLAETDKPLRSVAPAGSYIKHLLATKRYRTL
jgi:hypothetical protein